jgi:hypothetical protein
MSITIYQYDYKSVVKNFTIFAPVKHGTRWLKYCQPSANTPLHAHTKDGKPISAAYAVADVLFSDKGSPFINSKIKLESYKKQIIIENPVFIYRDPYEAFTKAILTGTHKSNNVSNKSDLHRAWDGNPETLNISMTSNGHFSPTIWQEMWEILESLDNNAITFVELRELSDFMMINTLKYYNYNFNDFTFEKDIVGDFTKDEIIEMCKEYHPILWKNFMIQVDKETIALNKLIEKFKWDGK